MLKNECGYQFTAKLEGMFKDMNTSVDLNERFQQHKNMMRQSGSGSFSVDLQATILKSARRSKLHVVLICSVLYVALYVHILVRYVSACM